MQHLIKPQFLLAHEANRGNFYKAVVTMLRDHGNIKKISRETDIAYNYLVRLANGSAAVPDVTRMEKLYTYLTGEIL